MLGTTDDEVTVFDALTYAGNLANLRDLDDDPRFRFVQGRHLRPRRRAATRWTATTPSSTSPPRATSTARSSAPTRSCAPTASAPTCCATWPAASASSAFLHISTDEVYGSIDEGSFRETDPLAPRSPYSAVKAGSDLIALVVPRRPTGCRSSSPARRTTSGRTSSRRRSSRCSPPTCSTGRTCRCTATAATSATGSTSRTTAAAVDLVLRSGVVGEIYNIGAGNEITNRELTDRLLAPAGRDETSIEYVDRPPRPRPPLLDRHDKVRGARLAAEPRRSTRLSSATVDWYRDNRWWWEPLKAAPRREGPRHRRRRASSATTSSRRSPTPATR